MKRLRYLYPIYFNIFSFLTFYLANKKELEIGVIFYPLFLSSIALFFIWILIQLLLKNFHRSSLTILIFILYFYSFGYISGKYRGSQSLFFAIYTLIFSILFIILLRIKEDRRYIIFLHIVGAYLILSSLLGIISYEIKRSSIKKVEPQNSKILLKRVDNDPPDIYYIIFDRYANDSVLKDYYDYDNTDFINYLENRGFYVAKESFANYPKTHLSLASSLNLDYLDDLVKKVGKENSDYTPVFDLVSNNMVAESLKALGYRYIYFGDWWNPTRISSLADKNINLFVNSDEFTRKFMGTTIVASLLGDYYRGNTLFGLFHDRVYENTNYKLRKIAEIYKEKSPKFIFAHMLFPHHPYVFDKNCGRTKSEFSEPDKKGYIEQLECANKKTKKLIDELIFHNNKAIIVIQSDEGPFKEDEMRLDGEGTDWSKVSVDAKKIHMKILNAYYLPGFDYSKLYPSISPVNSFRIIFNHYFQTKLKPLPDKSYFINHLDRPYDYVDITEIIRK